MQTLSKPIQEIFFRIRSQVERDVPESGGIAIDTHQIVSAAATLYEKLRYLIDYHEEHAIRRNAIERMLKRKILIEGKRAHSTSLLAELVEGGYLAHEDATKELAHRVDVSISRFSGIEPLLTKSSRRIILGYTASEIESLLESRGHLYDEAVVEAFYKSVRPRIQRSIEKSESLDIQTLLACRRALLRSDDAMLSYVLWRQYVLQWNVSQLMEDGPNIEVPIPEVSEIISKIRRDIDDPLQWQIAQKIKSESVYFRIIREFIEREPSEALNILENPEKMEVETRALLEKKYTRENKKARSSGLRAVMYLLCTKIILALAIELPYEKFVIHGASHLPLLINIVFHPTVLFALTHRVGSLGKDNTDAVVRGMQNVLYNNDTSPIYIRSGTRFLKTFAFLYFLLVLGVFGCILAILQALSFNIVSIALFFLFFVLVSYLAFRIRYNASRWKVLNDGVLSLIGNLFAVPIVRTGHWLSRKFSTVNMLVFIMDFIIETPFKSLLSFSKQFILYMKEKSDEVY